ncbi:MAG: TIGR02147 family protein [Pseudobdellovibrionaceae bacterium]
MVKIFEFTDYKLFLASIEEERASFQRGFRSRVAEVLGCQNAYISQILNTHANFSLEQAIKIAEFLQLDEIETRYFLLLIELARAGTSALKEFFSKDIEVLRAKHLNIKERVPNAKNLTPENQSLYYSSWLYPTIHMLVTIPNYRTIPKIAAALRVEDHIISEVIWFLITSGLVVETKGHLMPGPTQIHLSKDSSHIRQHHSNWRIAAIQSLTTKNDSNIHYSTVSSLSYDDAEKLKTKLVKVIQEYVEIIQPSKEETLYNFNLDFYSLLKK